MLGYILNLQTYVNYSVNVYTLVQQLNMRPLGIYKMFVGYYGVILVLQILSSIQTAKEGRGGVGQHSLGGNLKQTVLCTAEVE